MREQQCTNNYNALGFDPLYWTVDTTTYPDYFLIVRVTEVNKGSFCITDGTVEMAAELSGKCMYSIESSTELPTAGDWVIVQPLDNNTHGVIHAVLPRKTLLKRKVAGREVDFQLIGANIDTGFIVQPADNFNISSCERYLVMLNECGIVPVIILSKIDLLTPDELDNVHTKAASLNAAVAVISSINGDGFDVLKGLIENGKTYCLLGPSGAGKTSLLNRLTGDSLYRVQEVREKDGRGRHTTVRRQLILLESGGIIIDTPGMREIGNFDIDSGIAQTFDDIIALAEKCRFRDCTHVQEEGCAVIGAVTDGSIDVKRYQNYLKIRKEAQHYEMSFHEKRKKEKTFGKMLKRYNRDYRDKG
ncbi:MAG: ribosome small subunit-dependent GTPase A [Fibrobacter sp.]|nr:ribosome small subunit-dependent GTPase A [Fibrobacter sp.]